MTEQLLSRIEGLSVGFEFDARKPNAITALADKILSSIEAMSGRVTVQGGQDPVTRDQRMAGQELARAASIASDMRTRSLSIPDLWQPNVRVVQIIDECVDKQQATNRRALEKLHDANTIRDRTDAIREWGKETKENTKECLDKLKDQVEHMNDA